MQDRISIQSNYQSEQLTIYNVARYKPGHGSPETLAGPFTDYKAARDARDLEMVKAATTTATGKRRTRTVFSTDEIPHLWAHKAVPEGRNAHGNLYFNGDTIFSYGSHFPVATHVQNAKGKPAILFTTASYSSTTAGHKSAVSSAIPDSVPVFHVPSLGHGSRWLDHEDNLGKYVSDIKTTLARAARARTNTEWLLGDATKRRAELKAYVKFFGLKMPKAPMVPAADSDSLKAYRAKLAKEAAIKAKKTRIQDEKRRKEQAAAYARQIQFWMSEHPDYAARWDGSTAQAEALGQEFKDAEKARIALERLTAWMSDHADVSAQWDGSLDHGQTLKGEWSEAEEKRKNAESIAAWLRGERAHFPYSVPTMLRITGSNVETSRGAVFPVEHARRGLALVRAVMARGEEWYTNGHTCHLGHYKIERITPDGTVYAGCHVVTWEAIARIAPELEAAPKCRRCGNSGREMSSGICVDCLMSDKPWDALMPGKGEEADDNF